MTDARYDVRAWQSVQDGDVEAVLFDQKRDKVVAEFVENESLSPSSGLRTGMFYLSVDPTVEWRAGSGYPSLNFITSIDGDTVVYCEFMRVGGQMWRETTEERDSFHYLLENRHLIPLNLISRPQSSVMPEEMEYHSQTGAKLRGVETHET